MLPSRSTRFTTIMVLACGATSIVAMSRLTTTQSTMNRAWALCMRSVILELSQTISYMITISHLLTAVHGQRLNIPTALMGSFATIWFPYLRRITAYACTMTIHGNAPDLPTILVQFQWV